MSKIKAVIFDMGGVLIPSPMQLWKDFEVSLSLSPGSVTTTLLSNEVLPIFNALERGELTLPDFENIFTHFYNKQNNQTEHALLPIFSTHFDFADCSKLKIDKGWIALIKTLKAEGIKVGVLTNNWFTDRARSHPTHALGQYSCLFDVVVESCRIGMRKPDPAIYQYMIQVLKVEPQAIVFIDDLGANLKPARDLGFYTLKCENIEQTISDIENIVGISVKDHVIGTRIPTTEEDLPKESLIEYLAQKLGQKVEDLVVRKFVHGQSNPTYYIRLDKNKEFVLRKKPKGRLLPSAHLIDREVRVQTAIRGLVPVVKVLDYEPGVLDTPFYLMEYCRGRVLTDPNLPDCSPEEREEIYRAAAKVLWLIHSVDLAQAGLLDYGPPGNYMERNLKRLVSQYQLSHPAPIEGVDRLIQWLQTNLPTSHRRTLVHGDFRLDNLIFHPSQAQVLAVIDWEMSTVGDPLSDLASCLFPHYFSSQAASFLGLSGAPPAGIPSVEEFMNDYFSHCPTLNRPSLMEWNFYVAFAAFRNAVLMAGVYRRFLDGQASNADTAARFAEMPSQMIELGLRVIGHQAVHTYNHGLVATMPEGMSSHAFEIYTKVKTFIFEQILPIEKELMAFAEGELRWTRNPQIEMLKQKARGAGLWNLFITTHLDPANRFGGAGLTNAEYANVCELTGYSMFAPEVFNCSAPDTGNMEVVIKYGTPSQQTQFLVPLLDGKSRSCFAMTEPDVASSDATNIQGSIVRDNDHFLINARKWFTSGAADPNCRLCIFMGRILPLASTQKHKQQSMLLVPFDTEGIQLIRPLKTLGFEDAPGGHCEVVFENVRVPAQNLILGEGRGFEIAQGRLGPGRIHHCMRLIGHAERALHLMRQRIQSPTRLVHGRPLKDFQNVRVELAESRVQVEQARLLVLKAAHMIDTVGAKKSASEIAMIKVVAPRMAGQVVDRVVQHFGAAGLTGDWPLASFLVWARSLRFADGPDIVHLETVAKKELLRSSL